MLDRGFWNKKKVFLTGHTGFKGGWLTTWLVEMGAQVAGYAQKPDTEPSFFALSGLGERMHSVMGDVREKEDVRRAMQAHQPEIVFHLAAQSLVRRSYREPVDTIATNVMGTVHVLEAMRWTPSVRAAVIVTSDKCYENRDQIQGYREDEPMGGRDPYSSSKGSAELVTAAYRRSFLENADRPVGVATVRAGNVIGGGDWAEDRLVPDAIRALQHGRPLVVRNPGAVRPWQHVLEPLSGYLMLAERLHHESGKWAGAWNFGPRDEDAVAVAALAERIVRLWGEGAWQAAPEQDAPHEASYLKLDCSKATQLLGWRPRLTLEEAVDMTVAWYRQALSSGLDRGMHKMTGEQIRSYEARMRSVQG
jgi:CDP-glucose 4,6-dehydratase